MKASMVKSISSHARETRSTSLSSNDLAAQKHYCVAYLNPITYSQLIYTQKFVVDYAQELGNANAKNFTFIPCPLFFNDSQQHLEWQEMRKGNRPALYELSKNLNVRFFVLQNEIEEP